MTEPDSSPLSVPPSAPSPAPDPGPSGPGALAALGGVFTSPGATFGALAARPTWWLPFVLWLVVVALSILVATSKVDMSSTVREALEKRGAQTGQKFAEEQIQAQTAAVEKFSKLGAPIGTVFSAALFFLAAGCLWGSGRAMGGEMSFRQVLSVWSHANLPNVVGGLLAIPIFLQMPDASLSQKAAQHAIKSNVGAFLPLDTPAALMSLAGSIDVFALAGLTLLVVGFRRLPGLSKGAATAVPVVLWGLYVAGKVAWAAAFGG